MINPPKMLAPIQSVAAKAQTDPRSTDVIISLITKYGGERAYSVPADRVDSLISDLQKTQAGSGGGTTKNVNGGVPPKDANGGGTAKEANGAAPAKDANNVTVRTPKRWVVATGLPQHPIVIVVFDPQTEVQAGFAFNEKAAKELALQLVKNADALTDQPHGI